MLTFVANENTGLLGRRSKTNLGEAAGRSLQRTGQRRRIAFVGGVDRRGDNDARVEVDDVLGFVREMRRAVLHSGDLRIGIGLARPVLIRELLALALTIEPNEVVDRRRLDAALLSH